MRIKYSFIRNVIWATLFLTAIAMSCNAQLSRQDLTTKIEKMDKARTKAVLSGLLLNQIWTGYALTNGHAQEHIARDKYGHYWVLMNFSGTMFFLTKNEILGWCSSLTLIFGKELYDLHFRGTGFSWLDVQAGLTSTLTMYLIYKVDN